MSSVSIVSPDVADRLKRDCGFKVNKLTKMKYVHPAGYSSVVGYSIELELKVELSSSVSFTTNFDFGILL
jgi:hypothetical protein